jgi:hypothetical protein
MRSGQRMSPDVLTAVISSGATALVAIVALIQNNKAVSRLEKHWDTRFDDLKELIKFRFDSLDRRFDDAEKRISDLEHTRIVR